MAEIYICDDNEMDRRRLAVGLSRYFRKNYMSPEIREFTDGAALLAAWEKTQVKPALLFLDIFMEGLDGIKVAEKIRETERSVPIIFITSSGNHGVDAFAVYANGYLKKPYTKKELYKAVEPFKGRMAADARTLPLKIRREEKRIPLWQIEYLETSGHQTFVHVLQDGVPSALLRCNVPIGEFREKLLPEVGFMECGKSYIVNLNQVKKKEGNEITMQSGEKVYMPLRLEAELRAYMEEYYHDNDIAL